MYIHGDIKLNYTRIKEKSILDIVKKKNDNNRKLYFVFEQQ